MTTKNILLVYNPYSKGGKSSKEFLEFLSLLQASQLSYYLYATKGTGDKPYIQRLVETMDFTHICIIGGDGTINLTLNSLENLHLPIHIIPAGTGNDLAKLIYGDKRLEVIYKLINAEEPTTMKVDIWRCNELRFANGFGAGFDGAIANKTSQNSAFVSSTMKYWSEIFKQLFFYRSQTFTVNGVAYPTFMLSAANGKRYGGGFNVAPNAIINDGLLDINRIGKIYSPLRLLFLPLVVYRKHLGRSIVNAQKLDELTISSNKKLAAHVDGEPLNESSYHIKKDGQMTVLC